MNPDTSPLRVLIDIAIGVGAAGIVAWVFFQITLRLVGLL